MYPNYNGGAPRYANLAKQAPSKGVVCGFDSHPRHFVRSADDVRLALALAAEGLNPCQIARTTAIPRSTIRDWIASGPPAGRYGHKKTPAPYDLAALPRAAYAYLFGIYLGDGHISELERTFRLRVFMDSRYPGIIGEVVRATRSVLDGHRVGVRRVRPHNLVVITTYSSQLARLFPQHGPGRKHERAIVLVDWQQEIVDEHTDLFLRGLIHSDGCRVMNKVWGGKYAYPRYFFTQESVDIMDLFTDACDRIGIRYAFTKRNTVSVARAASVALLDEFVGPKR